MKTYQNSRRTIHAAIAVMLCLGTLVYAQPAGSGKAARGKAATQKAHRDSEREANREKHAPDASKAEERREEFRKKHPLDNRDPRVNARQVRQGERIEQGIKTGQLTKDETQELRSETKEIREEEKEYKSDGELTKDERKDLHQDLNTVSKDIYEEKHDDETSEGVIPKKAGTHDPSINHTQLQQEQRIHEGVKSGELTKHEAVSIQEREARLARLEKRLKEDGSLTSAERARLQKLYNELSQSIFKQKHDGQERD